MGEIEAFPGFGRTAIATEIETHGAVLLGQDVKVCVPHPRVEGVAVQQDHRRAGAFDFIVQSVAPADGAESALERIRSRSALGKQQTCGQQDGKRKFHIDMMVYSVTSSPGTVSAS